MSKLKLAVVFLLFTAACASSPPKGWQQGGAPLLLPRARWVNGETLVDVDAEGRVTWGGRHVLTLDRAGRVYDAYNTPVALLQPDGFLLGEDDDPLGWVGGNEAILPGDGHSWLAMDQQGLLLRIDDDGDQRPFGQWMGCGGVATMQACMLVSHVIGQQIMERRRSREIGPSVGIGIGFGF